MELSVWAQVAIGLVIVVHVVAAYFEMYQFPWFAHRVAKIDRTAAEQCRVVGWNQGLYNLFFVVGLLFTLVTKYGPENWAVQVFCLSSLAVAGIGAWVSMKNLRVGLAQTVPAGIALALIF